jgi:hypothetical protein
MRRRVTVHMKIDTACARPVRRVAPLEGVPPSAWANAEAQWPSPRQGRRGGWAGIPCHRAFGWIPPRSILARYALSY